MKVYTYVKLDLDGRVIEERSFDYLGPVALCDGGGGGGGGEGISAASSEGIAGMMSGVGGIGPGSAHEGEEGFGEAPGDLGPSGQGEAPAEDSITQFAKDFLKGASAGAATANPAIALIGGLISAVGGQAQGGNVAEYGGEGPADMASPTAKAGTKPAEPTEPPGEEEGTGAEPGDQDTLDAEGRLAERRRQARQRAGYWGTRQTTAAELGPLNIFTPQLYQ